MPLFYLAIPKLHPFTTDQWSLLECCSEFYDVSSKLIEPNSGGGGGLLEPPIYSQLVRSTDDNLDSQLASDMCARMLVCVCVCVGVRAPGEGAWKGEAVL